jgi:alpha-beta hydrolase superfamily lysophospholipase
MTKPITPTSIDGYCHRHHRHTAADGTPLFQRTFRPAKGRPTGRLDVVHGWADHSGRYTHLLKALTPLNLEVNLPDLRGHGHSGGKRGHIRRFDDYLQDLAQLFSLKDPRPGGKTPRWLLGHSMGGLVAFHLALRYPRHYQGLILSAPYMANLPTTSPGLRWLFRLLAWLIPVLPLTHKVDLQGISHDPAEITAYAEDPLVHRTITPRWFNEILTAQNRALHEAAFLSLPLLMQLSPDDTVVDSQASLAVYLRLPGGAKTLRVYPRCGHELYNESEPNRTKPLKDLVVWIGERQEAHLMEASRR